MNPIIEDALQAIAAAQADIAAVQAACQHEHLEQDYHDYGIQTRDRVWCNDCGETLSSMEIGGSFPAQKPEDARQRALAYREKSPGKKP